MTVSTSASTSAPLSHFRFHRRHERTETSTAPAQRTQARMELPECGRTESPLPPSFPWFNNPPSGKAGGQVDGRGKGRGGGSSGRASARPMEGGSLHCHRAQPRSAGLTGVLAVDPRHIIETAGGRFRGSSQALHGPQAPGPPLVCVSAAAGLGNQTSHANGTHWPMPRSPCT